MTDLNSLIHSYIETWNEADPARRRELVERTWTEDATYLDPLMAGEGHQGIDGMIAQAQRQYPGHRFELCFGPDGTTTASDSPGTCSAPTPRGWSRPGSTSDRSARTAGCRR